MRGSLLHSCASSPNTTLSLTGRVVRRLSKSTLCFDQCSWIRILHSFEQTILIWGTWMELYDPKGYQALRKCKSRSSSGQETRMPYLSGFLSTSRTFSWSEPSTSGYGPVDLFHILQRNAKRTAGCKLFSFQNVGILYRTTTKKKTLNACLLFTETIQVQEQHFFDSFDTTYWILFGKTHHSKHHVPLTWSLPCQLELQRMFEHSNIIRLRVSRTNFFLQTNVRWRSLVCFWLTHCGAKLRPRAMHAWHYSWNLALTLVMSRRAAKNSKEAVTWTFNLTRSIKDNPSKVSNTFLVAESEVCFAPGSMCSMLWPQASSDRWRLRKYQTRSCLTDLRFVKIGHGPGKDYMLFVCFLRSLPSSQPMHTAQPHPHCSLR